MVGTTKAADSTVHLYYSVNVLHHGDVPNTDRGEYEYMAHLQKKREYRRRPGQGRETEE